MKSDTVKALKRQKDQISLEVHAIEGGLYTAYCCIGEGEPTVIHRNDGTPLRARSIQEVKSAVEGIHFIDKTLVIRTAYDEMIHTNTYSEPVKARLHW
jgi:hypothetical protein